MTLSRQNRAKARVGIVADEPPAFKCGTCRGIHDFHEAQLARARREIAQKDATIRRLEQLLRIPEGSAA